jgi:hypothetical protein
MFRPIRSTSAASARALALAVGLFGACATAPATAQDCQLVVQSGKLVLMPGDSTPVQVFARFPPTAHAFASAQLRVLADIPAWLNASAGVIAGSDVVNIQVGQVHQPFLGVLADPSNPLRIWTGTFQPSSWVPRIVQVETSPLAFSYYPSKLTGSTAPCEAQATREWIFVNPQPIGQSRVAPGEGTRIVRTGPNEFRAEGVQERIMIGQLLPAVQAAREAARAEIGPNPALDLLSMALVPERTAISHATTVLAWARVNGSPVPGCRATSADAASFEFHAFRGGVSVAAIDAPSGELPCGLQELPLRFGSRVRHDRRAGRTRVIGRAEFAREQTLLVPGRTPIVCDTLEVHAVQHNLKQIAIGAHVFEGTGASGVQVVLLDGSVR